MLQEEELIEKDIAAYLEQNQRKELLRLLTAGSVDDGKSTLIGRLLHDSKLVYEDTMATIKRDSAKRGSAGGELDLSLLTDGLKAEREQGITIDVAYRFFSTAKRKFIIGDCPGHEQYTRNMATGASTADLAIILVDARHGILTQTRRHSFIVSLLGIRHVVVTINKMDLVDFSQARFDEICQEYRDFASRLDLPDLHFIPISALKGDNVVDPSVNMPWYRGSTLMNMLETVYIGSDRNLEDFRFPVQLVNRPNLDFRGFCGTVASGIIRKGDEIVILPSKRSSRVKSIVTYDGELNEAFAPQSVTLTLEDEVDCSRGDMIVRPGNVPKVASDFDAMLVWLAAEPMIPGKTYIFKQTTKSTQGQIDTLRYRIDVNSMHRSPAPELQLNEIGRCRVALNQPIQYDPYRRNRNTGSFIVIDRITNVTVGAGMILDRDTAKSAGDAWETETSESLASDSLRMEQVSEQERQARFGQSPVTILLTGLSGSGKSSIAYGLERALFDLGRAVAVLDGDQVRRGMNSDLGYSTEDRSENLRRSGHMAKLLNDNGLIAIAAFVAPSQAVRDRVAELIGRSRFIVVHCNASVDSCRARDSRGHYAAADRGELLNYPGVTAPYEAPTNPDLQLDTSKISIAEAVNALVELLRSRRIIR